MLGARSGANDSEVTGRGLRRVLRLVLRNG